MCKSFHKSLIYFLLHSYIHEAGSSFCLWIFEHGRCYFLVREIRSKKKLRSGGKEIEEFCQKKIGMEFNNIKLLQANHLLNLNRTFRQKVNVIPNCFISFYLFVISFVWIFIIYNLLEMFRMISDHAIALADLSMQWIDMFFIQLFIIINCNCFGHCNCFDNYSEIAICSIQTEKEKRSLCFFHFPFFISSAAICVWAFLPIAWQHAGRPFYASSNRNIVISYSPDSAIT